MRRGRGSYSLGDGDHGVIEDSEGDMEGVGQPDGVGEGGTDEDGALQEREQRQRHLSHQRPVEPQPAGRQSRSGSCVKQSDSVDRPKGSSRGTSVLVLPTNV